MFCLTGLLIARERRADTIVHPAEGPSFGVAPCQHTHTHIYIYNSVHTYSVPFMWTDHMYVCMYIHTYIHTYIYTYICTCHAHILYIHYTHIYIIAHNTLCTNVHNIHVYMYMYMYIHTYIIHIIHITYMHSYIHTLYTYCTVYLLQVHVNGCVLTGKTGLTGFSQPEDSINQIQLIINVIV